MNKFSSIIIFSISVVQLTYAIEDYCSMNAFNDVGNDMHFTKEVNNDEYAIAGEFKGLHCCARGFKSIEWYKNEQIYPWDLELSTFILFPESANQTIYTQNIRTDDQGIYTCVLKNDTMKKWHRIHLKVFDKVPDELKVTYISPNREAYHGENLRLFCEAFAGRLDLPDAHYEARWYKQLSNGSRIDVPKRLIQQKITRENGQTFGTYLVFPAMIDKDFATYTCLITKPGTRIEMNVTITRKLSMEYYNPNPFPTKEALVCIVLFILLFGIMFYVVYNYGLIMALNLKDKFGRLEDGDGKTHDVLIAYAPSDAELTIGVLVPNLNSRGYQCLIRELNCNISQWCSELAGYTKLSRRIIVLLSPATLNNRWNSAEVYQALKQLQSIPAGNVICVALKELPINRNEIKNSIGETLESLAKMMKVILWQRSYDNIFWLRLCNKLPAKRKRITYKNCDINLCSYSTANTASIA